MEIAPLLSGLNVGGDDEETDAPGPAPVDGQEELAVPKSRAGRAWQRVIPALLVTAVMVIFVVQNLHKTKISFLTFSGRFPVALALLVAAALGALVVFLLGTVRIAQFRKAFRRHQAHHDTTRGKT